MDTNPAGLDVGDVDNDTRLDLVVANFEGESVSVLLGDGAGGFTDAAGSPFGVARSSLQAITLGDVDADGNLDIGLADFVNGARVFLGDGTGAFAKAASSPFGPPSGAVDLVFADVDGM